MSFTGYINLTTGEIDVQETDQELKKLYLGGRGLGAALLYRGTQPSVKPFDPENVLIFTVGPFNGTTWPASARTHVTFKSPATQAYGYANMGGHFGAELAKAGYDALVVTGKADKPTLARVIPEGIELLPADELWGLSTSQAEGILREDGGGQVASIGIAGENLVRMAAIITGEGRAAARSGPGAVMGSKNLKAVHVIAGRKGLKRSREFLATAKEAAQHQINHPRAQLLMNESTLFLMQIKNNIGDLPARNHQASSVPFIDSVNTKAFSKYWKKRMGCAACPIRCSRQVELETEDETIRYEGPEYESANAFGAMCWNADPEVVIKANHLCNEYGMDTISVGVVIAFAMECHEKGLIEDNEFSLEWGDAHSILGLVDSIARRDGLGDILAEGARLAAERIGQGAEAYAMQVKGVELPRQEPRLIKGMALTHAVSNRGADHLYSLSTMDTNGIWDEARKIYPEEIVEQVMDTSDETYKPDIVIRGEHLCAIADSLGICKFSTAQNLTIMPDRMANGLQALGLDYSEEDLWTIGERVVNLERLFNAREGLRRSDDALPKRFTEEPLDVYLYQPDPDSGEMVKIEEPIATGALVDLDKMLDRYYMLRGWDENGVPLPETLRRLDIALD